MQRLARTISNIILFFIFLLMFLLAFQSRIQLPVWLQVVGRLHPLVLHIPIGAVVFSFVLLFFRRQFRKKQFQKVLLICLLFTSLSASITALFGFFLSINGDYGAEALLQHKVGGVVFSLVSYALLLWFRFGNNDHRIFYGIGMIAFLSLIVAGHTGSVLTHGENYILAPAMHTSASAKDPETTSLYDLAVKPVLEKKCFSCHNESKAKGKLVMTSIDKFKMGGKSGTAWVSGYPDSSLMIQNIHLPLEHDDHMPPDGKPQLSAFEISLLETWVRSGADFEKKLHEFPESDTLVALATTILSSRNKTTQAVTYDFKPVKADLLEELNTPFRSVSPLYQNSPALQADFFIREYYQPTSLEELKAVKDQLVSLNLSKMPVTDNDLRVVSEFKNLERLNLNFTSIRGEGLRHLASMTRLKSIALSGTDITRENLEVVLSIPALRQVFIWNTGIREKERSDLQAEHPGITFIYQLYEGGETLALGKPQLVNEGVLRVGDKLQLRHAMPGVTIRYSLNDVPDSVSGSVYKEPVVVGETVRLSAIACKEGWYCSSILDATVFVEGHKPGSVTLLAPPDKQYPGEGAATLTDLQKGLSDFFREPSWLGYRENAFEAGFHFGSKPPVIEKVVLSYGDNLGSYIFPPAEVEVWGGEHKNDLKRVKLVKFEMPSSYRSNKVEALTISLEPSSHAYYKIIARPVNKLPEWHGGKGQKGWFFIDEVFFY
jgi:uncharacterized membrane protein